MEKSLCSFSRPLNSGQFCANSDKDCEQTVRYYLRSETSTVTLEFPNDLALTGQVWNWAGFDIELQLLGNPIETQGNFKMTGEHHALEMVRSAIFLKATYL